MFINSISILVRQERNKDLLRKVEREQLIQTAGLRSSSAWRISLPVLGLRRGRFNFGAALKSLLPLTYRAERR
jgi:hypothetical protein